MDACGKFGDHERSIRVARGVAKSNSSFLSALQTSQVYPYLDICTAKSMDQFFCHIVATKCPKVVRRKQVLFVIDYKILSMGCTKKKGSYQLFTNAHQWYGLNKKVVNENLLL